jgi:ankyrin repeat protein
MDTKTVQLFALLGGGGHYMSQRVAPRSPLGIQDILFSAYQRHSLSTNAILSAFMHMQLAICYLVGFGVDRNMNQVHKNLAVAAGSQYPSIRPLLVRLRQAFDLGQAEQPLPPLVDKMATQNVSILLAAIEQPVYSSPLYEIGQVWKKTQVEELGIGSELHHAAYIGEVEGAARLLQQGQSDHLNETGHTALMLACINGSLPMVRLLLENGSNLQVKDPDGYTVWHMLTMFPSADIVPTASLFFTHSKDSDLINTYSPSPYILPEMFDALIGTPLHWAIQTNNLGAVEALLESGAKTDIQYNGLLSPIELAASLRLHSVLEILFKHAKLRSTDLSVEMPLFSMNECHPLRLVFLHGANLKDSTTKTVELLVKYWNIDTLNSVGWTPVLKLCLTGFSDIDKDLVLTMLRWAQPHVEGQQYPLIIASLLGCMNNKPSNSTLPVNLINQGLPLTATTSSSDDRGWNVLHWAAALQNIAVIQATLNKDPQLVNSPTVSPAGEYPLNIAATQSNSEGLLRTLKTLAEAGADPTAESKEHGLTPLGSFIAEQPADFDGPAFEYLLSINKANGFIVTQLELNPWTALHLATNLAARFTVVDNFKPLNLLRHALQFEEIKGLLEGRTKEGFTPILLAAMHADYATVRVLAEAGADITVMSHRGSTCMSLLLEQSRRPLSQLARQFGTKWDGENFRAKWLHNAYRAAAYVSERLGTVSGYNGLVLPKLHVAAYMCYRIEVKRLVESGEDVNSTVSSRATKTARGLLEGIISLAEERGRPWPKDALADAQEVIEYLKLRERPQESGEDA